MKKIWVNKASSFKEAEEFDKNYYLSMSARERLEIMQFLRESYREWRRGLRHENRKGLRRYIKMLQQT